MLRKWISLFFILLFMLQLAGCSVKADLSPSTNSAQSAVNDASDTAQESLSIKESTSKNSSDSGTQNSDGNSPADSAKINVLKVVLLQRESTTTENSKTVYGENFIVKSTVTDKAILSRFSDILSSDEAIQKSEGDWVKFSPARANRYAMKIYHSDGKVTVLNLHYTLESSTCYVAIALLEADTDYNTFVNKENAADYFEKCFVDPGTAMFLQDLFND